MVELTPRYDGAKTGADCTGTDGQAGRTYQLLYNNYYAMVELLVQGAPQHEGIDFNVGNDTITFLNPIFDVYVISIRYYTSNGATIVSSGYAYATTTEVYRTAGLSATDVSVVDVTNQIASSEVTVCRETKNIYWKTNLNNQAITTATNDSITQTGAGWTTGDYVDQYLMIISGVGAGQARKITANTTDTITVDRIFATNPDNTSKFKVFYVPADFSPYQDVQIDGNGLTYMYLPYYPTQIIESLAIGETPTTVSVSNIYNYKNTGKIQLKRGAEMVTFSRDYPQEVDVQYWYGVDSLPLDVKRFVELNAAMKILAQYMTTVANKASNVSFPELSITNPQAYMVAKTTMDKLQLEYENLIKSIKIWPTFA